MGINARMHSKNFKTVFTCEKVEEYYKKALERLVKYPNVVIDLMDSPEFLKKYTEYHNQSKKDEIPFFYLDAHFYNPNLPEGKEKFVVLKELKALEGFKDSVIAIHDFDNGLGHCRYDGIRLDMDLVREDILKVNKDFKFYTNRLESCDIYDTNTILDSGLEIDYETMDNIRYANSSPRLKFRGILYALPSELKDKELEELGLRKWN
jgi:hypothetical protein